MLTIDANKNFGMHLSLDNEYENLLKSTCIEKAHLSTTTLHSGSTSAHVYVSKCNDEREADQATSPVNSVLIDSSGDEREIATHNRDKYRQMIAECINRKLFIPLKKIKENNICKANGSFTDKTINMIEYSVPNENNSDVNRDDGLVCMISEVRGQAMDVYVEDNHDTICTDFVVENNNIEECIDSFAIEDSTEPANENLLIDDGYQNKHHFSGLAGSDECDISDAELTIDTGDYNDDQSNLEILFEMPSTPIKTNQTHQCFLPRSAPSKSPETTSHSVGNVDPNTNLKEAKKNSKPHGKEKKRRKPYETKSKLLDGSKKKLKTGRKWESPESSEIRLQNELPGFNWLENKIKHGPTIDVKEGKMDFKWPIRNEFRDRKQRMERQWKNDSNGSNFGHSHFGSRSNDHVSAEKIALQVVEDLISHVIECENKSPSPCQTPQNCPDKRGSCNSFIMYDENITKDPPTSGDIESHMPLVTSHYQEQQEDSHSLELINVETVSPVRDMMAVESGHKYKKPTLQPTVSPKLQFKEYEMSNSKPYTYMNLPTGRTTVANGIEKKPIRPGSSPAIAGIESYNPSKDLTANRCLSADDVVKYRISQENATKDNVDFLKEHVDQLRGISTAKNQSAYRFNPQLQKTIASPNSNSEVRLPKIKKVNTKTNFPFPSASTEGFRKPNTAQSSIPVLPFGMPSSVASQPSLRSHPMTSSMQGYDNNGPKTGNEFSPTLGQSSSFHGGYLAGGYGMPTTPGKPNLAGILPMWNMKTPHTFSPKVIQMPSDLRNGPLPNMEDISKMGNSISSILEKAKFSSKEEDDDVTIIQTSLNRSQKQEKSALAKQLETQYSNTAQFMDKYKRDMMYLEEMRNLEKRGLFQSQEGKLHALECMERKQRQLRANSLLSPVGRRNDSGENSVLLNILNINKPNFQSLPPTMKSDINSAQIPPVGHVLGNPSMPLQLSQHHMPYHSTANPVLSSLDNQFATSNLQRLNSGGHSSLARPNFSMMDTGLDLFQRNMDNSKMYNMGIQNNVSWDAVRNQPMITSVRNGIDSRGLVIDKEKAMRVQAGLKMANIAKSSPLESLAYPTQPRSMPVYQNVYSPTGNVYHQNHLSHGEVLQKTSHGIGPTNYEQLLESNIAQDRNYYGHTANNQHQLNYFPNTDPFSMEKKQRMFNEEMRKQKQTMCANMQVPNKQLATSQSLVMEPNFNVQKSLEFKRLKCKKCDRKAVFICSGCKNAWYCTPVCQRMDWLGHYTQCK